MLHGRFMHASITLTDLQILGCELHQNALGVRAGGSYITPPGPQPLLGEEKRGEGKSCE